MSEEAKRIVIVGAGMAGLTAAAYALRDGYDVLLLEKNDRWGGLLNTFESNGFSFDAGPRAFVNSGIVQPIFKDLGIEGEFLENKITIGIEDQLMRVDSIDATRNYQRILEHLYPESKADIENIIASIDRLSYYTSVLYEFDNPNFTDLMGDPKYIFRKLIPWTFKFLNALRKFNRYDMPMEDYLKSLTDNQSLTDIILQHFFRQTPTYFALGYFYVYLDYFYPKGGTVVLADLLKDRIVDQGGEMKLNTEIVKVHPAEATITDSNGESYSYDHLIWTADLKTLYRSLDPSGLEPRVAEQIEAETRRMLSAKGAESVFILFLGVDRPLSYFQQRGGEHMFYTPSREGLGETNREARTRLVNNVGALSEDDLWTWVNDYVSLNTYEVSIPALRDPALAPEGQTGVMISCLLDYDIVAKIEEAGLYAEFKNSLEKRIIQVFSRSIYKDLAKDLLFTFSSTPFTIEQVSGSSEGAITGWSFETDVPVVDRLKDIPKSVNTPIPGVLQAGQWSYSPAGVPIAMLTGWYAAQDIKKRTKPV